MAPPARWAPLEWHFDIDEFINPFLPPSPLPRLPPVVSHFLGYRKSPLRPLGNLVVVFWAFVGAFAAVTVLEAVSAHVPSFRDHGSPAIIGSFGATAVLEFYAIESVLSQPRNVVFGQLLSSIIGVSVCKLFALAGPQRFQSIRWLGGSLACAAATAVMALTGTVHPPAGATALIAVMENDVVALGWWLIPVILLGCALMEVVALVINNLQRQFPAYWWTPQEVGQFWRREKGMEESEQCDVEAEAGKEGEPHHEHESYGAAVTRFRTVSVDSAAAAEAAAAGPEEPRLIITRETVIAPEGMNLRPEERTFLESLGQRL